MSTSPESHIQSLEERAENIQRSYHESTDLIGGGVDKMVGFFGGETVKNEYIKQMNLIKKQANEERQKLLKAIADKQINQPTVAPLLTRLNTIAKQELEDTSFLQATKNTDVVQAGKNAISGVQGEINGVVHSTVSVITGTFDLLKFLGKYSISYLGYHPEYKDKVNTQAQQLYAYLKKEGMGGVQEKAVTLFNQEIERISKLPQEQQAQAIGNIAGNVIGMLTIMKVGVVTVGKIGKIGKQVKRGEILLAREISKEVPNLARANKLEGLLKSASQSKNVLNITNILLNGIAESIIGLVLTKQIEYAIKWIFDNKSTPVLEKIRALDETLRDLDNQYRMESDETKKQQILQVIEAYKNHESVKRVLKYKQKRDNILEKAFQGSADMFHVGEDILRKNPDINGSDLAQQIEEHFKMGGKQLSKDQKEMLITTATSLEKAKQNRHMQLEEIFQKAGVTIPKKLEDIELMMNTNSNIQFEEWKNYSVERGGIDYLDTVLARNKDTTFKAMKKEGVNESIQNLTQKQKEKIAWLLEGGIETIKFNLTSHPTCIIHQFKEASSYINDSLGHITLGTGKIYIRGGQTQKEMQDTIEHEYQHFLNLAFVEPVMRQLRSKALDGSWSKYEQRFGESDQQIYTIMQWESMKDEIASYLERNGTLAPDFSGYLSKDKQGQISSKVYGLKFDSIQLFDGVLHELIKHGAKNKDIVDIIRTSAGFEHAYTRLRQKYKHTIDLPIDIKQLKLKGIDEIIANLNKYNETIGYDNVQFKKNRDAIKSEYGVKVGNVHLDFYLETKTSDPIKVKAFLENIYNKINSSPTISIKPDQDEIKEVLKHSIENFGIAHIDGLGYIDQDLILHSQRLGNISLFNNSTESKKVLEIFFLNTNNTS